MTDHREQLIAYLATLAALVIIFISSLVASGRGVTITEAFGLGTVMGGLIGLLRLPSSRSVTVDNTKAEPVPTEPQA